MPDMKPGRLCACITSLFVAACVLPRPVLGHATGLSTGDLKFGTNGLEAELTVAAADLMAVLAHAETLEPLDANHDGKLSQEEFTANLERFKKLALGALAVEFDGRRMAPALPSFAMDAQQNFHILLSFPGSRPRRLIVRAMLFGYFPADHLQFISVVDLDGKALGNRMLNAKENSLEITLPVADRASSAREPQVSTFGGFLLLGVKHIWTGYDHIMFLLALLLVCPDFKTAVKIVTAFTIAHSITLAFATLNLVWVSSRVVEPLIAASIVYVGAENFLRQQDPKARWRIAFLFGLIHGFGFATVLRDLGVASSTTRVTVPLVAFNLGVEAGQIVIAGVLLPIIWKLRKWERFLRWGVPACSGIVAAVGGYWLIQRLWFT